MAFKTVQDKKLKWDRLPRGRCPKCGKKLEYDKLNLMFNCSCDFRISKEKFHDVTARMDEDDDFYDWQFKEGWDIY